MERVKEDDIRRLWGNESVLLTGPVRHTAIQNGGGGGN